MKFKHVMLSMAATLFACGGGSTGSSESETSTGTSGATTSPTTENPTTGMSDAQTTGTDPSGTGSESETAGPTTSDTTAPTTDTATTSDTVSDTDATTGGVDCPIFETDIVPIFQQSCGAGDQNCHRREAYGADSNANCRGWLSLENAALGSEIYSGDNEGQPTGCPDTPLYERLLNLDAWNCEDFDPRVKYVIPCDADASYLMRKINGGAYCKNPMGEVTQAMPPGVELEANKIATIEAWINAGAPTLANPECGCEDPTTGGESDSDSDSETGTGDAPVAEIWHPGDGEMRKVDVPIPFIGVANDTEDGELTGAALVWESSLEGVIGMGKEFNAPLTQLGVHTITLTATDSDENEGMASIMIEVIP
ncbi:MAG: hypothetical protein ACPG4T_20695 [Nannocystaceae bacterium]